MVIDVTLINGTVHTMKTTFGGSLRERPREYIFQVVSSATLPTGRMMHLPFSSVLYIVEQSRKSE